MKKTKKLIAAVLAVTISAAFTGCDKSENPGSVPESPAVVSDSETGFNIDRARKSIVVKGLPFEIPTPLKDIKGDWSYTIDDRVWREGTCLVNVYYKDELMLAGGGENYFNGKDKEAIMYNTTIKTDDCSVDGITPLKTTKQEVLEKYGEPDSINEDSEGEIFYYGERGQNNYINGRANDQCVTIGINKNGIVDLVSVTYADLTKEY